MKIKKYLIFLCFVFLGVFAKAQSYFLEGTVINESEMPLPDVKIFVQDLGQTATTDSQGKFRFEKLPEGDYIFIAVALGYDNKIISYTLTEDTVLSEPWIMELPGFELEGVQITGTYEPHRIEKIETISSEIIHNDYIRQNLSGSLIQTLEKLPGIKSMSIGSSSSKPLIRGLGFNEVAVIEDGIKHEGQQWGVDHGLEIDQFNAETVEISRGPASFMYGSDAVGGVIVMNSTKRPGKFTSGGSFDVIGKTNTMHYGSSLHLYTRKDKWFADGRLTYHNYGDYTVPAETIYPYNYSVRLHKNRVRNTAGREFHKFLRAGYIGNNFNSEFYFTNFYNKKGSFANAHGLEPMNVDEEMHDASRRDILLPYDKVSHTKIVNRTEWNIGNHQLKFDLGFQNNFRQEFSPYMAHGYMPPSYPGDRPDPSDLEMEYFKNVYSINARDKIDFDKHSLTFGINGEIQENKIKGWGFLIPEFKNYKIGGFLFDKWELNDNFMVLGAIRYDYGKIDIKEYRDWFESEISHDGNTTYANLVRAPEFQKEFHSLTYSLGFQYDINTQFTLSSNLGKAFRMPAAHELAANGVNYDYYRFEKGNANLNPEESYQMDIALDWNTENLHLRITPFINYFDNFIYLNPTSDYDTHYGAGNQIFEYTQAPVFRTGTELAAEVKFNNLFTFSGNLEYVYSRQVSGDKKGYTLPFTPPLSGLAGISYTPELFSKYLEDSYINLEARIAAPQNKIVPPEEKTPGYHVWSLSLGTGIKMKNEEVVQINMSVSNLFNQKYFDHTNYYRLIQLPEQGRNIVLSVHIPFNF